MKIRVLAVAALSAVLLSASGVRADQLEVVSQAQAVKAVEFLKKQKQILVYCGCCNDNEKRLLLVSTVGYKDVGSGQFTVYVDGITEDGLRVTADLDLAYTHYLAGGKAHNVGKALGFECDPCVEPFAYRAKPVAEMEAAAAAAQAAQGSASKTNSANSLHERAQAYVNTKEYDKAAADWTEAIKLAASGADKALYSYNRGVTYLYMRDYDKAIADFTVALAAKPDGDTHVARGLAYGKKEDYAKAAADYETALKLSPSEPTNVAKALAETKAKLHHQKSIAFAVKEDVANAIREIDEAIKLQPNEIGYVWTRGVLHAEDGQYGKAKADIGAVLKAKPNYPGAKEMLERINEEERKAAEDQTPPRVQAGQQAGPRGGRGGQRGGARPESALRFYNRGMNAYNARDYEMAIASFTDAIRINPRDAGSYDGRAGAYAKKRDYDRAIADYAEAIRLSPRRADFYANRGDAYMDKGSYNRAATDYAEAIRLDPKNADYYCYRGEAYLEMSDYRRAADDFESALRLDPRHPDAQDLLRQARSQGRGYGSRGGRKLRR